MAEEKNLVHILKLLDDDSPTVRQHVWEKIEANLPAWEAGIRARLDDIPSVPRRKLLDLLSGRARKDFRASWLRWRDLPSDAEKLEAALSGLSWYLSEDRSGGDTSAADDGEAEGEDPPGAEEAGMDSGSATDSGDGPEDPLRHPGLGPLLDGLAAEFRASGNPQRATALARFLFADKGLKGSESDYYNPANSDLVRVIGTGKGIPISLACIFMLVGHRLGFGISGCDVPEHFLTRVSEEGKDLIIDCFDGGRILEAEQLAQLERKYAPEFSRLLRSTAKPEAIVARVLRNLINAYHLAGNRRASQFMWSLAEDLRGDREAGVAGEGGERGQPGEPGAEA